MNNPFYEVTNNNYFISSNPAFLDITAIHSYLSQESHWRWSLTSVNALLDL